MIDRINNKEMDKLRANECIASNTDTKLVNIRVGYRDTDKMGYVHHSQYLVYYEFARLEYFRELGISYKEIEDKGIMMPVIAAKLDYKSPAFYDDVLTIKTKLNIVGAKFIFQSEIINSDNKIINKGTIQVVCIDSISRKPIKPYKFIANLIDKKIEVNINAKTT